MVLPGSLASSAYCFASLSLRRATEGAELCLSPNSGLLDGLVFDTGRLEVFGGSVPSDRVFLDRSRSISSAVKQLTNESF